MNIAFLQMYTEVGAAFDRLDGPLLEAMSVRLPRPEQQLAALSKRLGTWDFKLLLTLSAHRAIDEVQIKGPTFWPKKATVGFSLFLPWRVTQDFQDEANYALPKIADGVRAIYELYGADTSGIKLALEEVLAAIRANPAKFRYPAGRA